MHTLIALAAAANVAAEAPPARPDRATFADWRVTCDNTRACVAIGLGADEADPGWIRIFRGSGASDVPEVSFGTYVGWAPKDVHPHLRLEVPGRWRTDQPVAQDGPSYRGAALPAAEVATALDALLEGAEAQLTAVAPEGRQASVSLKGSKAALLWMDDRQQRVDTVTALVATGPAPASSMPPSPSAPLVKRAPTPSQAGLPKTRPAYVEDAAAGCAPEEAEVTVARLKPGRLLWSARCTGPSFGYNGDVRLFLSDEAGRRVPDPQIDSDERPNLQFDVATMTLSSAEYGRYMKDCGSRTLDVYDGLAFRPVEEAALYECHGVAPKDWPVSFRAKVAQ